MGRVVVGGGSGGSGAIFARTLGVGFEACCWCEVGTDMCDVAVVLVLADDEREKVKLALVDTVRFDCSDMRDADRCRFSASYDAFLVCDGARCGMTGALGLMFWTSSRAAAAGAAAWAGAVK